VLRFDRLEAQANVCRIPFPSVHHGPSFLAREFWDLRIRYQISLESCSATRIIQQISVARLSRFIRGRRNSK
jgi:hypothetical protein